MKVARQLCDEIQEHIDCARAPAGEHSTIHGNSAVEDTEPWAREAFEATKMMYASCAANAAT